MKNKEVENIVVYDDSRDEYNTIKLEFILKNIYVVVSANLGFGYNVTLGIIKNEQGNQSIEDLLEGMERDYSQFERYRLKELNIGIFRKTKIKKAFSEIMLKGSI
jgi:hypothetical protein